MKVLDYVPFKLMESVESCYIRDDRHAHTAVSAWI